MVEVEQRESAPQEMHNKSDASYTRRPLSVANTSGTDCLICTLNMDLNKQINRKDTRHSAGLSLDVVAMKQGLTLSSFHQTHSWPHSGLPILWLSRNRTKTTCSSVLVGPGEPEAQWRGRRECDPKARVFQVLSLVSGGRRKCT